MGYYDLPATINYIKKITKRPKIIYLGFSMGGTVGLVYASLRPKETENSVNLMVLVAPCTSFKHTETYFRYLIPCLMYFQRILKISHYNTLDVSPDRWYIKLFKIFHHYFPLKKYLPYFIGYFHGHTPDESDPKFSNALISSLHGNYPLKTLNHFYHIFVHNGNFVYFDYEERNFDFYGQKTPPVYPLENIKAPIFQIFSKDDTFSDAKDNRFLSSLLPDAVKKFGNLEVEGLNHADFVFGKHRIERVYEKILQLLDKL